MPVATALPALQQAWADGSQAGYSPNSTGQHARPASAARRGPTGGRGNDSPRPQSPSVHEHPLTGSSSKDLTAAVSQLTPAMESLETVLRGQLQETTQQNITVLQALQHAAGLPLGTGHGHMQGALSVAMSSPSINPGASSPAHLAPPLQAQYATATTSGSARLAAALTPSKSAGGMRPEAGTGVSEARSVSQSAGGIASPGRPISAGSLGPRWGATEGGRDTLNWVRTLVRFGERAPVFSTVDDRKNLLPTLKQPAASHQAQQVVAGREDVVLLSNWLQDMVQQLSSTQAAALAGQIAGHEAASTARRAGMQATASVLTARKADDDVMQQADAGSQPAVAAAAAAIRTDLADNILQVYLVAFEEVKRQVGTECKERAALLSMLWDHWSSALELRTNLQAQARISSLQAEYVQLLAAKDELQQDVGTLQGTLTATQKEVQQAQAATAHTSRSLAGKLASAQAQALELTQNHRVAELALTNEAERRLETERQLALTKQLLSKSEHEWLAYRAKAAQLEAENEGLHAQLRGSRDELEAAAVAADAAHQEYSRLMTQYTSQEVDMSRVRRELETDEILVTSLKQQVRDLETQLAQLKAFQRDQALKLGAVAADKEALEADKTSLQDKLAAEQSHVSSLEAQLTETEQSLAKCQAQLHDKELEYQQLQKQKDEELKEAGRKLSDMHTELRHTTDQLSDSQFKLSSSEIKRHEFEAEVNSLRQMLEGICRTLDTQGVDGVPKPADVSWSKPGPLGAAQKAIMLTSRQLSSLWERLDNSQQEAAMLRESVEMERGRTAQLQEDLHASRAQEARVISEKERFEVQLDIAHQAKRVLEMEATALKTELIEAQARANQMTVLVQQQEVELDKLRPMQAENRKLLGQVEDVSDSLRVTSAALVAAKEDITQLTSQQTYYKEAADRLIGENAKLVHRVKELVLFEMEAQELGGEVKILQDELQEIQTRLEAALGAHADTLHQLEIARFFLQGLDLVPPRERAHSTTSQPVGDAARPGSAMSTGTSTSVELQSIGVGTAGAANTSTSGVQASGSSSVRIPRATIGWRPTTAPGKVHRTMSERPRSALGRSSIAHGSPQQGRSNSLLGIETVPEDVELLQVSSIPLMSESNEDAASDAGSEAVSSSSFDVQSIGGASVRDLMHSSTTLGSRHLKVPGASEGGVSALLSAAGFMGRPSSARSRPGSAASHGSDGGLLADMPEDVAAMLSSRGVGTRLDNSASKWLNLKVKVMAGFSAKLRAQLLQATERNAELELQLIQQELNALQEAQAREQQIDEELSNLHGLLERTTHQMHQDLQAVRTDVPIIMADAAKLCNVSSHLGKNMMELEKAWKSKRHVACQSADALEPRWAHFLQSLPQAPPHQPLSNAALNEAIVRIYLRALPSVEVMPVWGAPRVDTVYDAIMQHYTCQSAHGSFTSEYVEDIEGPIGRLLRCVRMAASSTRAGMFACLTGMSPDGTVWPVTTWHFLLHALYCLQQLLAGTWHTTVKAWCNQSHGVAVPLQAVHDLVGNLYNVQSPADLPRPILMRLASIVLPGLTGPQVDMDALLLLLVAEYNAGHCPRSPMLYPRRLTDGTLFNLFNSLGHAPQASALQDGRAGSLISTLPRPGSPSAMSGSPFITTKRPPSATMRPKTAQHDLNAAELLSATSEGDFDATKAAAAQPPMGVDGKELPTEGHGKPVSRSGWVQGEPNVDGSIAHATIREQYLTDSDPHAVINHTSHAVTHHSSQAGKLASEYPRVGAGTRNLGKGGGVPLGPPLGAANGQGKAMGPGASLHLT